MVVNRLRHTERTVRRNLNFANAKENMESCETWKTPKRIQRVITKVNDNVSLTTSEKKLQSSGRKSLLLPPNTIKNIHVKNRLMDSGSMSSRLNETLVLLADSAKNCPVISEVYKGVSSSVVENMSAPDAHWYKENKTVIQHTSLSQIFNANDRSGLNVSHSCNLVDGNDDTVRKENVARSNLDRDTDMSKVYGSRSSDDNIDNKHQLLVREANSDTEARDCLDLQTNVARTPFADAERSRKKSKKLKELRCSTTVERATSSRVKCFSVATSNWEKDLYASLLNVKESEFSENVRHGDVKKSNEYAPRDDEKFAIFASKLRPLIYRLEEDLSDLKLLLTFITNENLSDEAEVVGSTGIAVGVTPITVSMDHKSDNVPVKSVRKTLTSDSLSRIDVPEIKIDNVETQSLQLVSDGNKENEENPNTSVKAKRDSRSESETRRRSTRLMAKALRDSSSVNDSFVNLERELCIASEKSDTTVGKNCTPMINKYDKKAGGKAWREYLALKSRMSCLLTPNAKRPNDILVSENKQVSGARASLSSKILTDLHNLYADSPNMQ